MANPFVTTVVHNPKQSPILRCYRVTSLCDVPAPRSRLRSRFFRGTARINSALYRSRKSPSTRCRRGVVSLPGKELEQLGKGVAEGQRKGRKRKGSTSRRRARSRPFSAGTIPRRLSSNPFQASSPGAHAVTTVYKFRGLRRLALD